MLKKLPGPSNDLDLLLLKKGLSLLHQNVRGLFKYFDLVLDLLGNNNAISIFSLSETHIRTTEEASVLNVSVYTFLSLPH